MAARSRGPPRSRLKRARARRKSGACMSARRKASRIGARLDQEIKRIEPPIDSLRVGQRTRQPLGEQASPCGGHGQVDRRQKRTVARAAQGPRELEVGAGRGIDFEARPARAPGRSRERRPGLELGALDISQRERGGGDLGAGERAEAVEGFDAVELADPPFGRRAVAAVARERRRGNAHLTDDLGKRRFFVHGLRSDDLARLKPRDLRGEARFVRLAERDRAGRQIERGEPVNRAAPRSSAASGRRPEDAPGRARAAAPR